jgi:hypothetical protein
LFLLCFRIIFNVTAKNGGYVVVNNRETKRDATYFYEGSTRTREFEFHWDLDNPYHCSVANGASCSAFVSVGNDITDNVIFFFTTVVPLLKGISHQKPPLLSGQISDTLRHSSNFHIRPLPPKAAPLISQDFRSIEILKCY